MDINVKSISIIYRMASTNQSQSANCERKDPQGGKLYIYINSLLNTKVSIHITEVGTNIKENLEILLNEQFGGKCIEEGYIKPKSIRIHSYSPGLVANELVDFHVMYHCQVSRPVEGQVVDCKVKTVTKAGVHAQCIDHDKNVPITVFIARDHHASNHEFQNLKEGDKIYACVIGTRFELNDPYICVIAKLISSKFTSRFQTSNTLARSEKQERIQIETVSDEESDEQDIKRDENIDAEQNSIDEQEDTDEESENEKDERE